MWVHAVGPRTGFSGGPAPARGALPLAQPSGLPLPAWLPAPSAAGCPRIRSGMSCRLSKDPWLLSLGGSVRKQSLGLPVLAASGMSLAERHLFSLLGSSIVL